LWKKKFTRADKKAMEVKYIIMKHKVLKKSLHDQIWSDFEKFEFFLNVQEKKSARQIAFIPGKNQNHKRQFFDEFCACVYLTFFNFVILFELSI
jgi:hypothetical protein